MIGPENLEPETAPRKAMFRTGMRKCLGVAEAEKNRPAANPATANGCVIGSFKVVPKARAIRGFNRTNTNGR